MGQSGHAKALRWTDEARGNRGLQRVRRFVLPLISARIQTMKVLVTGGAGYVGMNVVEALLARKDQVTLLDAGELPAAVKTALAPHGALVEVIRADICDATGVDRAFAERRIDGVIH